MMNAVFAATLCSIVLGSVPVAAAAFVLAQRNGEKRRRRRCR